MPISELLIREFDNEMSKTEKTLERVPAGKWDWKPHEKSGSLGWMAGHIATLPGFGTVIMTTPELDVSGVQIPKVERQADLVSSFKKISGEARAALAGLTDEQLGQMWTLKRQGKTIFSLPRYDALRSMFFNHIIHHRAQLTMYLRTLNVPGPALYGPSADENPFG
jgi:uncharacterized damage-inducible protein DinB